MDKDERRNELQNKKDKIENDILRRVDRSISQRESRRQKRKK
jgi:hypothetical protein